MTFIVPLLGLALQSAAQPVDPSQFVGCPTGVYVRSGQPCPKIGPHPAYLYFDRDRAKLTERARLTLDGLIANLRVARSAGVAQPPVLIESHADRSGPPGYNLELSRRRAETIRDYLIGGGFTPNAIGITYFGEERVALDTPDGAEEPDNRRAVVWLVHPEHPVRSRR